MALPRCLTAARARALRQRADLVVLDTNLLKAADPTRLFKAHVLFTMGGGAVLYDKL